MFDSEVRATLDGWTKAELILVNPPKSLWHPRNEDTVPWNTGYQTHEYWSVADACGPPANAVPSVAFREQFGSFSDAPGTNYPVPPITSSAGFNFGTYAWFDTIGVFGTYTPTPTFTTSQPPYTYNTVIKSGQQFWYMGSQNPGAGHLVFSGTIFFYRDHGHSQ